MSVDSPVTLLRSTAVPKATKGAKVSREGGDYGAGYIKDFAVITANVEALGHGLWVDDYFAGQVGAALRASENGVKSRFTHPGASADSLTKGLGRVKFSRMANGILYGDLHFWQSASKSPDGDLREFLLTKAEEDPTAFGASIAFVADADAMEDFELLHTGTLGFRSPDPANTQNLPHARLASLRYVDLVDDPAANPEGLFHRDDVFAEADQLMSYALGLTDEKPSQTNFGVDADRLLGFATRFLESKGLRIMKINLSEETPEVEVPQTETPETETPETEVETPETPETEAETPETPETPEPERAFPPVEENNGPSPGGAFDMAALDKYCETFGAEAGLALFRSETPYIEALEKQFSTVKAELSTTKEKLAEHVKLAELSEASPLSASGGDVTRKGFQSKIKV